MWIWFFIGMVVGFVLCFVVSACIIIYEIKKLGKYTEPPKLGLLW